MAKGPDAFRTISEAADELGVPQHVLRFWETRFSFIRPMKRAGGRRFYRPSDIAVLRGVRKLLHDDGYSIKSVQRLHREQGVRSLVAAGAGVAPPALATPSKPNAPPPLAGPTAEPAPVAPAVEPLAAAAEPKPARKPISDLDRRRLRAALEDLTAIKADIDRLLAQTR
jgi:DNA-binding transcriptional MerR regulator